MTLRLAPAERRQSIVDAAVPLFARKGFAGTTTREIAEAAGVSEALVFKYFASKTALYEAMFDSCREVSPALLRVQQLPPGTAALVEIVQLVVAYFSGLDYRVERDKSHHRLFLRSLLEDGEFARTGLRAFAETMLPLFGQCYEAARRAGDLVPEAPAADAAFWVMTQAPLMLGSLVLTGSETAMCGFSHRDLIFGILRGLGLRDAAIPAYADLDGVASRPEILAAAG
jgi:AcrR family transcriptional regulator